MPEGIVPLRPTERSFVGLRCPSGLLPRNASSSAIAGVTLNPESGNPGTVHSNPDFQESARAERHRRAQADFRGVIAANFLFATIRSEGSLPVPARCTSHAFGCGLVSWPM